MHERENKETTCFVRGYSIRRLDRALFRARFSAKCEATTSVMDVHVMSAVKFFNLSMMGEEVVLLE